MGLMIEQQAEIDCLTNTAKYYEREDADKWTKGIHYGLLHGLDNILDNVSPVEAIPKDLYKARVKDDMMAMLEEVKKEIIALPFPQREPEYMRGYSYCRGNILDYVIQEKINALMENEDGSN